MKSSLALTLALGVTGLTLTAGAAPEAKRLNRSDSFFGLHFDFHAGKDCTEIGKNTTRAMIENLITQVKPDYLQIDWKGHPGLSSYPTKAGNQAPAFIGGAWLARTFAPPRSACSRSLDAT
jgi:hypothetical protein